MEPTEPAASKRIGVPVESDASATKVAPGDKPDALAKRAVLGAVWTIATGVGSRAIGLVGTLVLTRYLAPAVYGEVSLAAVVVQTAQVFSSCGLSQYVVSKPRAGREAVFHATFYFTLLGLAALGVVALFGSRIGPWFDAPGLAAYIPGLALAGVFERLATIQDRIQVRDMRYRTVGVNRSLGEATYSVVTVGLAMLGYGGMAVVIGTLVRSLVRLAFLTSTTDWREWLTPARITWKRTKELFAFGLPMSTAGLAAFGSRRWDNLLFSSLFGPAAAGMYNLAYNLADIPATQIGDTIGDVLVPSFAQMDDKRRQNALIRAVTLLTLIVSPLAIGLGSIAPTLVATLFDSRWAKVAPMLLVLAALSVVRPLSWIVSSHLQVRDRPGAIMGLECAKTFLLLVAIATLGRLGPLFACAAVGLAFGLSAFGYLLVFRHIEAIPLRRVLAPLVPPLLACVPVPIAVLGARRALAPLAPSPGIALAVEMVAAVAAFIPSAALVAPRAFDDCLALLKSALRR